MFWRGAPFPGVKPLQQPWTLDACGTVVTGTDTQLEAELEAIIEAINCDFHDSYDPDTPGVPNTDQICCQPIVGGGTRCYTIKAGRLVALNQASADQIAHALACYIATRSAMSLSDIDPTVCLGKFYGEFIATNGAFGHVTFSITGPSPPGLEFDDIGDGSMSVSGMPDPAGAGAYAFLVTARDSLGTRVTKPYTLTVFGISNLTSMPAGAIGNPYSFQLTGTGGTAPRVFSISDGALPAGLTMSATGLISGTPTTVGSAPFTIKITDASGLSCSYPTSINVIDVGYQVCNWPTIRAKLDTGSWPASAFPGAAWDGTFSLNNKTVAPSGTTYFFLLSKSINAKATAANEAPGYPVGAWADNDSYTQLSYVPGSGTWFLAFAPAGAGADPNSYVYQGPANFNPNDGSGVYTLIYSVAGTPPTTITVQKTGATCCPDWSKLNYTAAILAPGNVGGTCSGSAVGNTVIIAGKAGAGSCSQVTGLNGSLLYTGPDFDAYITLNVTTFSAFGNTDGGDFAFYQDGVELAVVRMGDLFGGNPIQIIDADGTRNLTIVAPQSYTIHIHGIAGTNSLLELRPKKIPATFAAWVFACPPNTTTLNYNLFVSC